MKDLIGITVQFASHTYTIVSVKNGWMQIMDEETDVVFEFKLTGMPKEIQNQLNSMPYANRREFY